MTYLLKGLDEKLKEITLETSYYYNIFVKAGEDFEIRNLKFEMKMILLGYL